MATIFSDIEHTKDKDSNPKQPDSDGNQAIQNPTPTKKLKVDHPVSQQAASIEQTYNQNSFDTNKLVSADINGVPDSVTDEASNNNDKDDSTVKSLTNNPNTILTEQEPKNIFASQILEAKAESIPANECFSNNDQSVNFLPETAVLAAQSMDDFIPLPNTHNEIVNSKNGSSFSINDTAISTIAQSEESSKVIPHFSTADSTTAFEAPIQTSSGCQSFENIEHNSKHNIDSQHADTLLDFPNTEGEINLIQTSDSFATNLKVEDSTMFNEDAISPLTDIQVDSDHENDTSVKEEDPNLSVKSPEVLDAKSRPARANKLLLPVLPPAETFEYSPELYNENHLLNTYPQTFKSPERVDVLTLTSEELIEVIERICVTQGEPLVIQNFHKLEGFDPAIFSLEWLKEAYTDKEVHIRDLKLKKDIHLDFNKYLSSVEGLSASEIRYYGKDIECPPEWEKASKQFLPTYLQYMGPTDLNGLLDDRLKIDNLMIYVGHEGTHTATHFDICGSVGHNLMVQADEGCSALWFMVPRDNANDARKFWHKFGGGNTTIDQDNCILPAQVMGLAGFPIYTFQQYLGDFVIVPSESAHQVVNIGKGCTIKFSWNRNTATSLSQCINSVLPVNRRLIKMETYRTKTMVEQGVIQWGKLLKKNVLSDLSTNDRERFCRDYRILLETYAKIISADVVDSSYQPIVQESPKVSSDSYAHSRTCDFCRCDIWNNWFHCDKCVMNKRLGIYGHDLCVDCFAENRKCLNYQEFEWFCHRPIEKCFKDLVKFSEIYNKLPEFKGLTSHDPVMIRPNLKSFEDLHPGEFSPVTLAVKNNDQYKIADHLTCHQCAISRFSADMVYCTTCIRRFCHGCLSNRYAVNPFDLARDKSWKCYYCQGKCNCAKCARKFGEDNVIPLPPNPFCLKDYYENYYLGYGLSYFPVGESKVLVPNVVDFQTFLGRKKGMDKATDKNVQARLIPYTGPKVTPQNRASKPSPSLEDKEVMNSETPKKQKAAAKPRVKRKAQAALESIADPDIDVTTLNDSFTATDPDSNSKEFTKPKRAKKQGKKLATSVDINPETEENLVTPISDVKLEIQKSSPTATMNDESHVIKSPVSPLVDGNPKPVRKRGRPKKNPIPEISHQSDVFDSANNVLSGNLEQPILEAKHTEELPAPVDFQASVEESQLQNETNTEACGLTVENTEPVNDYTIERGPTNDSLNDV